MAHEAVETRLVYKDRHWVYDDVVVEADAVRFHQIKYYYSNLIDYARVVMCLLAVFTIGMNWPMFTAILVVGSVLLDWVDGPVARAYHQCTIFGSGVDWLADVLAQVVLMVWLGHRTKGNIIELKTYFNGVIDWVSSVFRDGEKEMQGLEWGRLYEQYHSKSYGPAKVSAEVKRLYGDPYVKNRRGVFEYILGGLQDSKLLDVRVFDEATKKSVYAKQTSAAEAKSTSNCPLCAVGHAANKSKIWKFAEMDADHVSAWSKGGGSSAENCQMLCATHNRAKGNR